MALTENPEFKLRLLRKLGNIGLKHIRPKVTSRTLKLQLRLDFDTLLRFVDIYVPHYWALIHHDGRKSVKPVTARKLVWFPDIRNDPRVAGGLQYPIRMDQRRRLTKAQFKAGVLRNKTQPGFMVISKKSGPTKRPNNPFFVEGTGPEFKRDVDAAALELTEKFILKGLITDKDVATLRI